MQSRMKNVGVLLWMRVSHATSSVSWAAGGRALPCVGDRDRDRVRRGLACCSAMRASKPAPRFAMETSERGVVYGRATDNRPLGRSWVASAFGRGLPSRSSSVIGRGVWEYIHGQVMVSPDVGRMRCEYAPQKQCWKKTWRAAHIARRCPRDRDPMTRSEGREEAGTGIMPPVHLQRGACSHVCDCLHEDWEPLS